MAWTIAAGAARAAAQAVQDAPAPWPGDGPLGRAAQVGMGSVGLLVSAHPAAGHWWWPQERRCRSAQRGPCRPAPHRCASGDGRRARSPSCGRWPNGVRTWPPNAPACRPAGFLAARSDPRQGSPAPAALRFPAASGQSPATLPYPLQVDHHLSPEKGSPCINEHAWWRPRWRSSSPPPHAAAATRRPGPPPMTTPPAASPRNPRPRPLH